MSKEIKPKRRDFLFTATYTIGAVGLGAVVWPLVDQMNPDSSVKALSTTEVDVSSENETASEETDVSLDQLSEAENETSEVIPDDSDTTNN